MQLIKYTAKNPFGRFEDCRPQLPDEYLNAVKSVSSEMVFGPLRSAGPIAIAKS